MSDFSAIAAKVQAGERLREFQGTLQFVLDVQQDGRKIVLTLPPEPGSVAQAREQVCDAIAELLWITRQHGKPRQEIARATGNEYYVLMLDSIRDVLVSAQTKGLANPRTPEAEAKLAQDQASAIDEWALFQAKGTKLNLAESVLDQLSLERDMRPELSVDARGRLDKKIAEYTGRVKLYETE